MSKNNLAIDPYLYPGSSILINKFGLKDHDELQEVEGLIFGLQNLEPLPNGHFNYDHLKAIHHHFFYDVYEWAGQERTVDIAKGNCYFGHKQYITKELNKLFEKLKGDNYLLDHAHDEFCKKLSFYFNEINAAHPFREGNGRTQRAFCDLLAKQAGYHLDWTSVNREEYINASINGFLHGDYAAMESILKKITTQLHREYDFVEMSLEENTLEMLKTYVKKQLELAELINQKGFLPRNTSEKTISIGQSIVMVNKELHLIAKTLVANSDIQRIIKQQQPLSLQKLGGFAAIDLRFERNEIAFSDVLEVLRYAKNNIISVSQSANQKQEHGGHKR